jgi:hypothetical protein
VRGTEPPHNDPPVARVSHYVRAPGLLCRPSRRQLRAQKHEDRQAVALLATFVLQLPRN